MDTHKPNHQDTVSDLCMMGLLSAKERTDVMWQDLAKAAGLKVVKIWSSKVNVEKVIEMDLA